MHPEVVSFLSVCTISHRLWCRCRYLYLSALPLLFRGSIEIQAQNTGTAHESQWLNVYNWLCMKIHFIRMFVRRSLQLRLCVLYLCVCSIADACTHTQTCVCLVRFSMIVPKRLYYCCHSLSSPPLGALCSHFDQFIIIGTNRCYCLFSVCFCKALSCVPWFIIGFAYDISLRMQYWIHSQRVIAVHAIIILYVPSILETKTNRKSNTAVHLHWFGCLCNKHQFISWDSAKNLKLISEK